MTFGEYYFRRLGFFVTAKKKNPIIAKHAKGITKSVNALSNA